MVLKERFMYYLQNHLFVVIFQELVLRTDPKCVPLPCSEMGALHVKDNEC